MGNLSVNDKYDRSGMFLNLIWNFKVREKWLMSHIVFIQVFFAWGSLCHTVSCHFMYQSDISIGWRMCQNQNLTWTNLTKVRSFPPATKCDTVVVIWDSHWECGNKVTNYQPQKHKVSIWQQPSMEFVNWIVNE